jgi:urease accessory protein
VIDATTEVEVGLDSRGHSVVQRMVCEVPMLVRVIDEPGPRLTLAMVNGAAGPLGGDRLRFRLTLGPASQVTVISVAAAMAQPGARGGPSHLAVDLMVGDGAVLDWHPQPTVSVVGSDHRVVLRLSAESSSTVTIREGLSLGRRGENPGRFALRERITIGGSALLDHETVFAPDSLMGPGAQGAWRNMTTEVVIGEQLPAPCVNVTEACLTSTVHVSPVCALTTSRW